VSDLIMFWFSSKKRIKELEEKTENSFSSVKTDMDKVGKWIEHLNESNKQLLDVVDSFKQDLTTVRIDMDGLREGVELISAEGLDKQVFKKLPVLGKQTAVEGVQKVVQTAVQTGNFYDNFKELSGNERLVIFTLMNSEMKLSYEDLALLLGKERSTIRGQINAIKQKSGDLLIGEILEKNGKKRVFVPEETKGKLAKYAKVRAGGKKK